MLELFSLAIALSMDAFAVSIGLGAKQKMELRIIAFMSAIYFGIFQAIMPFVGYWAGKGVIHWADTYTPWIAFILLMLIGIKMIYESCKPGVEENIKTITHPVMLMLAIATSIDAMAAGFAINLLNINLLFSCFVIGLTTSLLSFAGVFFGAKSGTTLENKAELFGGIVLIVIGIKILLTSILT